VTEDSARAKQQNTLKNTTTSSFVSALTLSFQHIFIYCESCLVAQLQYNCPNCGK
jgi:hypothetical protein